MGIDSVTFHGPVTGPTGYDSVVRNIGLCLEARGIPVSLDGKEDWCGVFVPLTEGMRGVINTWKKRPSPARIVVNFCLPTQVKLRGDKINVCFTMYEPQAPPKRWMDALRSVDFLIVPTYFNKWGFVEAGFSADRIFVVPLGAHHIQSGDEFEPTTLALERNGRLGDVGAFKTVFLAVGEWVSRRQYPLLIKAYLDAFRDGYDNTVLVIRSSSYGSDRMRDVSKEIAASRSLMRSSAPIYLIGNVLDEQAMLGLFTISTHYVSMSAGEGWDLSCNQAAMCGLDVIVPKHTAYEEYLSDETATLLPVKTHSYHIPPDLGIGGVYDRGVSWAEPDYESMVSALRRADSSLYKGALAKEEMTRNYTWDKAAIRLLEVLDVISAF